MGARFNDKFSTRKRAESRKENTRQERAVKDDLLKIAFSFKDFDVQQVPPGQTYEEWQKKGYLAYLLEKLGHISELNMVEAKQRKIITEYGSFPTKSDFKHPRHIADTVNWAVIKNIKGQKGRVVGHIIDNVFYVVFLDINHRFWIVNK